MNRFTLPLLCLCATTGFAGTIELVAGTGRPGNSGDGGPASHAQLKMPFFLDFNRAGNLLIADTENSRVRVVDLKSGVISTLPGVNGAPIGFQPFALAVDANDDLYLVDRLGARVVKRDGKSGVVAVLAGTGKKAYAGDGGPASEASMIEPHDACLDGRGGLLVADVADWRIRRVDLKTGVISTFAGVGRPRSRPGRDAKGDGGPAAKAVVMGARAVCVDGLGNTYICEREGGTVRKVDAAGVITTFAGTGQKGYTGDGGDALSASFNGPKGVRCDRDGNLFVLDTENHAVRKIDARTHVIATVAGGRRGTAGLGGEPTQAGLNRPHGCLAARDGTLYIADTDNHRVLRVGPNP